MKRVIFLIVLSFLSSCSIQKNDVLGKYEYSGVQTIDVLLINKDKYVHEIFNKEGQLMYKGESTWELEKDRIIFLNFYNNEDYYLTEFLSEKQAEKFLTKLSCPIYRKDKKFIIEVNSDKDIIYYMNK